MDTLETLRFLYFAIGACFAVVAALVIAGCSWIFHYETKKRWEILKSIRHRNRRF